MKGFGKIQYHECARAKYLLLVVMMLGISGVIRAQMPLDSMLLLARPTVEWEVRKAALIDLADYYQMRNNDSIFHYSAILEAEGKARDDAESLFYSWEELGQLYHGRSQAELSRQLHHKALAIAQEHELVEEIAWASTGLGYSHGRGYNLDSSYYYHQLAEKSFIQAGLQELSWRCYVGYASVSKNRRDYDQADEHYRQALKLFSSREPSSTRGFLLYKIFAYAGQFRRFDLLAEVRILWNEYKGARQFDMENLERAEHFGLYELLASEDIDVKEMLFSALEHYRDSDRPVLLGSSYYDLGEIYYEEGRFPEAKMAYIKADSIYSAIGYSTHIAYIRKRLAELYQREGDYAQALAYTKATYWVLDSLKSEASERNLREFQVQYETEKKEQALRINQLELKQKTQERNVWIGSSIFLALLGLLVYVTLRQRMHQRELITTQEVALQAQRIQQLEQEKTVLALSSMIEGQELERQRIAKDLHDGMGGLLTTIKAHYSTIVSRFADQHAALNIAPLTGELIDRACTEVRRISQNMMPAALLYSGLEGALEDLAAQVRTNGLECTLEIVGGVERIDETRTIALYRVMQEAVNNILKHARAGHVLLQLIVHKDSVSAMIEDDGTGFVFVPGEQRKSLGLKSMDSRVRYLKGHCDIDSVVGEGTAISLQFPLE